MLKTDQIEIVAMNIFIPNFGLILSTISDKRHEKSMQTANILTRNQNTIIDTRDIKTSVIKVLEIELILWIVVYVQTRKACAPPIEQPLEQHNHDIFKKDTSCSIFVHRWKKNNLYDYD